MTTLESLSSRLPSVLCPVAPAIHPSVAAIESRAISWIDRTHLYSSSRERAWMIATNSAEWCARLMPGAVEERLQILTDWTYWGFFFDDQRCDGQPYCSRPGLLAELAGRLVRSIEGPPRKLPDSADPFIVALQDLHGRLTALASPLQLRRWIDGHRHWLASVVWLNSYNERGTVAPLDEYLASRGPAVAGPIVVSLSDFANGYELPEETYQDPVIRALSEMTWLIGGIDNDLQSWPKEQRLEESGQNIIAVVAHHFGCSPEAALAKAVALRNQIMQLFLLLSGQAAEGASEEAQRYLADLSHVIRGNLDWGRGVPRYTTQPCGDFESDLAREREQLLSDTTVGTEAPDTTALPSIAWWWSQLTPRIPGRIVCHGPDVDDGARIG
jgi:hypothetical protein